ncbi:hypothetical protein [Streptomyces uncialis]|uniref:glycine-rich domain-containing protein n=1 Tax=Streptomyces uncialis TaxID=1048205 RepID=UPI0038704FB3|nr:hypothetical protein OG268_06035 [Streptomyces uncialis]
MTAHHSPAGVPVRGRIRRSSLAMTGLSCLAVTAMALQPAAAQSRITNVRVFASNGTFTVPANVTTLTAVLIGPGGGGGAGGRGAGGFTGGGGGGGAGGPRLGCVLTVTPGQSLTIRPGEGGEGGTTTLLGATPGGLGEPASITVDTEILPRAIAAPPGGGLGGGPATSPVLGLPGRAGTGGPSGTGAAEQLSLCQGTGRTLTPGADGSRGTDGGTGGAGGTGGRPATLFCPLDSGNGGTGGNGGTSAGTDGNDGSSGCISLTYNT